jgi:hypothetical protein
VDFSTSSGTLFFGPLGRHFAIAIGSFLFAGTGFAHHRGSAVLIQDIRQKIWPVGIGAFQGKGMAPETGRL